MPLPLVPAGSHLLSKPDRFEVFCKYARFQPDHSLSGSDRYAVCVGRFVGGTFFAPDTMELREKFDRWALALRRKEREQAERPWRIFDALDQRFIPRSFYKTRKAASRAIRPMNGAHYVRYFVKKVGTHDRTLRP